MSDKVKYTIYSKALAMFNIVISSADVEEEDAEKIKHEVSLCNLWLDSAIDRVTHSFKWSFFAEPVETTRLKTDSLYGFNFAYEIKEDTETSIADIAEVLFNHKRVVYKKYNNIIYTNEPSIEVIAIIKPKLENLQDKVPSEFIDLIAYQLALLIAPSIAPKDNTIQTLIANQYNMANNSILRTETLGRMKRVSNEEV